VLKDSKLFYTNLIHPHQQMPSGTENETDQQRSTAGHNGPVAAKEAAVRQKENKRMFSQYERVSLSFFSNQFSHI